MKRLASSLFLQWRALLGRGVGHAHRSADGLSRYAEEVTDDLWATLGHNSVREKPRTWPLVVTGSFTLATGVFGTLLVGRDDLRASVASAGLMLLWCSARLLLLRVSAGARSPLQRGLIVRVWAMGLLPYAVAVTPVLHAIAWTLSLVLTLQALAHAGFSTRRLAWCLWWAYGTQVFALVGAWLFRNALFAGAALGS